MNDPTNMFSSTLHSVALHNVHRFTSRNLKLFQTLIAQQQGSRYYKTFLAVPLLPPEAAIFANLYNSTQLIADLHQMTVILSLQCKFAGSKYIMCFKLFELNSKAHFENCSLPALQNMFQPPKRYICRVGLPI